MAKLVADFTDVESGEGRVRVPEGDYRAKVTDVKAGTSKSSGNSMLTWEFTGTAGKVKGKKFKDYTTLTAESLWKLKGLLEALGLTVPSKKVDLTPLLRKAIGKELGITLGDDEYEGKISSKVQDYITLDTLEDIDEDDEEEDEEQDEEDEDETLKSKSKKKKGKKKAKNEDEDEIEELDLDEL